MMTALMSISTILSPLLMTNLFYNFTKPDTIYYFPGAPFAAAAILVLISSLLLRGE